MIPRRLDVTMATTAGLLQYKGWAGTGGGLAVGRGGRGGGRVGSGVGLEDGPLGPVGPAAPVGGVRATE